MGRFLSKEVKRDGLTLQWAIVCQDYRFLRNFDTAGKLKKWGQVSYSHLTDRCQPIGGGQKNNV